MSSYNYGGCLVALQGKAGAGKSTAARHLIESYGFQRERISGPLKDMMRAFGLNERQIEGDLKETPAEILCGRTPRYAMQVLGTEWGRVLIDPELWNGVWKMRADAILQGDAPGAVVVDDMRFPNEVPMLRERGGVIVRIEAPENVAPFPRAPFDAAEPPRLRTGSVKDMLRALGLDERQIDGDLQDAPAAILCGRTPRYAMDTLCTEWGCRLIHPDVWSGRMPSAERAAFVGPVEKNAPAAQQTARLTHVSETQELPADIVILNDGGLEELHAKIDQLAIDLSWAIEPARREASAPAML